MFSSGEASTLGTALSAVRRRIRLRRAAIGALLGAALAAGPAHLLALPSLVPIGAIVAGAVTLRRRLAPPAAWLDARDRDDLVLTAAALIEHRARQTDLAATVVASAAARVCRTRLPSLVPAALALAATAALILLVRIPDISSPSVPYDVPRTNPGRTTGFTVPSMPDSSAPRAGDAEKVAGTASGGTASAPVAGGDAEAVPGTATGGTASAPAPGAGDGAGLRGAAQGEAVEARAARELAISAPVAGAGAAVAAVPARYRGIVAAYLEAR